MGAAVSSNTAKSIATVSNQVSNSTNVSAAQVNAVQQQINFDDCFLMMSGDINIESASKMVAKSKQIVTALQQSHIQNTIAQQMMQQAKSQTGFLGVGFAEASNYASQMTDATSDVVNELTTVANQFNYIDQGFNCSGSTFIGKNFLLSQGSSANFFSEQVVKNQQISSIANDITQSITQKATATVSGMSAFLLIFVLLIAACGYTLSKPLSSGSGKMIIGTIMVIGIGLLIAVGFIFSWPPLFQQPNKCALTPMRFMPQTCKDPCIKVQKETLTIRTPVPFKFPIFDTPSAQIKSGSVVGSLNGMAISSAAKDPNLGTNMGMNAAMANELINSWNSFCTGNVLGQMTGNVRLPNTGGGGQKGTYKGEPDDETYISVKSVLTAQISSSPSQSFVEALAPMFVPTDKNGVLYAIPEQFVGTPGKGCDGSCMGLAFTLTGISNQTIPSGNTTNYTPKAATCGLENLTVTPTKNYTKMIVTNPSSDGKCSSNDCNIYAICPVTAGGKQNVVDGAALQCGCLVRDSGNLPGGQDMYKQVVGTTAQDNDGKQITNSNWNDVTVKATVRAGCLGETTVQADVIDVLKLNLQTRTTSSGNNIDLSAGWLPRYLRTFYYNQLDILSTCYWETDDLVLTELRNVYTIENGKQMPQALSGAKWLTVFDAKRGYTQWFNDDGKLGQTYYFDPVPCYQLGADGEINVTSAIEGLGQPGTYVTMEGDFGICDDRTYQFGQFAQKIGVYIAIGLVVIALFFVMLDHGNQSRHGASFENPAMVAASSGGEKESGDAEKPLEG